MDEVGDEAAIGYLPCQRPVQGHVTDRAERDDDRFWAVLSPKGGRECIYDLGLPQNPEVGRAGVRDGLYERLVRPQVHALLVEPKACPASEGVGHLDAHALVRGPPLLKTPPGVLVLSLRVALVRRRERERQHAHQCLEEGRQVMAICNHVRGLAAHERQRGYPCEVTDRRGKLILTVRETLYRQPQKLPQRLKVLQQEAIAACLADLPNCAHVPVHKLHCVL
mmetsp:Transcript_87677/g.277166  ORF Transcript_87677/g.277166 Transcript_87677/m.277166 type:complete len:223 (+) Transcript_87677:2611-3279(+)